MSAYITNLFTKTTSHYNSLRRQLLSDEADGDTEDDSHISRVLRAYYTEKGRPFPPWLPPDPKAPQAVPTQFVSSSGRQPGQQQMGRGGGLSDLWDAPQQSQQQDPLSLRRAQPRGGGARAFQGRTGISNSLTPEPQSQGRPLPSQRAGSYQSGLVGASDTSPPPSAGSGSTAQERLKAKLWGSARSTSPLQNASSANPPPPAAGARRSPFERTAQLGRPSPDERGSSYSGGGRQQSDTGMSANSPWSGEYDPYAPGGAYDSGSQRPPPGGGGRGGGRIGLPSGPKKR